MTTMILMKDNKSVRIQSFASQFCIECGIYDCGTFFVTGKSKYLNIIDTIKEGERLQNNGYKIIKVNR